MQGELALVCDGYEDKYEKIGNIIKTSYTDQGISGFHIIDSDSTTFTLYQATNYVWSIHFSLMLHDSGWKRGYIHSVWLHDSSQGWWIRRQGLGLEWVPDHHLGDRHRHSGPWWLENYEICCWYQEDKRIIWRLRFACKEIWVENFISNHFTRKRQPTFLSVDNLFTSKIYIFRYLNIKESS